MTQKQYASAAKTAQRGAEEQKNPGHNLTRRMENSTLKMCERAAGQKRFFCGRQEELRKARWERVDADPGRLCKNNFSIGAVCLR